MVKKEVVEVRGGGDDDNNDSKHNPNKSVGKELLAKWSEYRDRKKRGDVTLQK